jgi:DNA-binding NarL/FixJ family response regulator
MNNLKTDTPTTSKSILIVEDHDALRDSLRTWLGSVFEKCSFLVAKNGEDAIAIATTHKPEIVLMDITLPGINGIEATRCIRDTLPKTQVIILTIHDAPTYKTNAAEAGAFAFVPKHRMYSELIPTVQALLEYPTDSNFLSLKEVNEQKNSDKKN